MRGVPTGYPEIGTFMDSTKSWGGTKKRNAATAVRLRQTFGETQKRKKKIYASKQEGGMRRGAHYFRC